MMKMYSHTFSGQPAVQVESELQQLLQIVKEKGVKRYLEIGVGRGDTFHEIVRHMPEGSLAVAVDMPAAGWGFKEGQEYLEKAITDLKEKKYNVQEFFGSSADTEIFRKVFDIFLIHGHFDLIFIDGDHTYSGVLRDYMWYAPMGRIIALHDIADDMQPNDQKEIIEVPKFWQEMKEKSSGECLEFIESPGKMGIGVVIYANV